MYPPTRYLNWARRFYGQVRFDLATSGIPILPASELPRPDPAALGDPVATWSALRRAIATHNEVPQDEAFPALGTTHALWLACASVVAPGDDVLVENPAYEPLVRIAEGAGARVVSFERDPRECFALDPERVAKAMTPRTRLVVVTNLHNPSGVRARDEALRSIARLAEGRGAFLLVDEVYAPFDALIEPSGVFGGSARKLAPNVIAVSSLTKCFGLGQERIGWILAPEEIIARVDDALIASAGHLPRGYACDALGAFGQLPNLAERSRRLLAGKRAKVAAWVASQGLWWSAPSEGLFGVVRVPGRGDLTPLIEAAVTDHQVLVAPGSFFGMPDAFRIAWSISAELLDEGLGRLADALG
jgi:aspartate/methionine/tyrosine aminotransferase